MSCPLCDHLCCPSVFGGWVRQPVGEVLIILIFVLLLLWGLSVGGDGQELCLERCPWVESCAGWSALIWYGCGCALERERTAHSSASVQGFEDVPASFLFLIQGFLGLMVVPCPISDVLHFPVAQWVLQFIGA